MVIKAKTFVGAPAWRAHRPPDAASNEGETRAKWPRPASPLCARFSKQVRRRTGTISGCSYVRELYDGQTGELLAKTVVEAPQDNDPNFLEHQKRSGVILLDNWQEFCFGLGITASQMPAASGNYNYELAALVIDRAMADDRKQQSLAPAPSRGVDNMADLLDPTECLRAAAIRR
jgi:hypothetical protein